MAKRKKPVPAFTESDWLARTNPSAMIAFARTQPRASPRVWRLFLAAFWHWQAQHVARSDHAGTVRRAGYLAEWAETGKRPTELKDAEYERYIYFARSPAVGASRTARSRTPEGQSHLCLLLHEIFGNPFRSVVADPSWLTSTAVALAKGIYDDRAFDRMPILADALQDAGCNNDDVLTHCRDESQLHVRGCWVVDLVLGKV